MSETRDKHEERDEREVEAEELDGQKGEELPPREVMSILDPTGTPTGNLGPPQLGE